MAVQFDNNVSEWSRTTAADGKWLNKNTIQPLIERTEILRDAINDMTGSSVPELKAQLETEKQVRAEADTAEHTARSEADDALRRDIDGLSEQIGDTINLVEGQGIKLDEVDGGRYLKISANYNDGDNTTYGIFSSTSGAGYGKGGWELSESNGNLTTDGLEILGLKDNKVYHIEISGHFVVNTPNDTIISAYLLDSNGKKLYFNVDTSNSELVVPVSFAYSFIPTTNLDTTTGTYKYKLMKWTSMDEDGQKQGYDLGLTRAISEKVNIPVIASGGAGAYEHFLDAFEKGKADAVLAASLFHFGEIPIPKLKEYLRENNISVRL